MGDVLSDILTFTVIGIVTGSTFAIAASGLVVTYSTSRVFNIAHGAIGMVMAFTYWQVHVQMGLPTWLSLILVIGVIAPIFGAVIERTIARKLAGAPESVSLVVTVMLMVLLIVAAGQIWPPTARRADLFFASVRLRIFGINVTGHEMVTFFTAVAVAGGLYLFLNRTRVGISMRAAVDNPELVSLHGGAPGRLATLSWALGASLAAITGILLAPILQLSYIELTLVVITAYAAAMVGQLKNLPRTFVGAMILGLAVEYYKLLQNYLPTDFDPLGLVKGVRSTIPVIFLFIVMLLQPQQRLRVGTVQGTRLPPMPSMRRQLIAGGSLIAVVGIYTTIGSTAQVGTLGQALSTSLIMLSLVVISGYGGIISLGQMTFVGFGALTIIKMGGAINPMTLVIAGLVAAVAGAIIAIPALRLRGLYLGLATLAFASAMEKIVFDNGNIGFNYNGSALMQRPGLLTSERAYTVFVAVAFVAMALVVLRIRRGRFGRFLLAIRDSQMACGTLGLSIARARVATFAISAGLAGIAGGIHGGMFVSIGSSNYTMFQSLPLLLFAVVGGVTTVTGALMGGLFIGGLDLLTSAFPGAEVITYGLMMAVIVKLGDNPNGLVGMAGDLSRRIRGKQVRIGALTYVPSEQPTLVVPEAELVEAGV